MRPLSGNTGVCHVCKESKKLNDLIPRELVRPYIAGVIEQEFPDWSTAQYICQKDLSWYRLLYVQKMMEDDKGELSDLEVRVLSSLQEQELLSTNLNVEFEQRLTFGEKIADKVAAFGGSWGFIITFGVVLVVWITLNATALFFRPFDPYPFILLNLILSTLAAIQAPIIMMSQNRQEAKDRLRSEHDYVINLKAELEVRHLNEKVDHLIQHQWQRLLEIQQIQMELLEENRNNKK